MEFSNEFDVDVPVDEVFEALLDVERVAPCVPGAQVLEKTGEAAYKAAIKVKLGPVTMNYKADVEVVEADRTAHRATMRVRAKESRGQGTADATSSIALTEAGEATHATISTDVKLSGKAAAMGGRMVGDVSARMIHTFAANLVVMLRGAEPAQPTDAPGNAARPTELPPQAEVADHELDALELARSVAATRLRRPGSVALVLVATAILAFLVGRASKR